MADQTAPAPNGFPPETPWWARLGITYGVPFLLVMYLLGMFDGVPGIKSPITRLSDSFNAATMAQVEVIKGLKDSVDRERVESATDRKTMIQQLEGMRSDLYATRMRAK